MVSLRKHSLAHRGSPEESLPRTVTHESPSSPRKVRDARRTNVLSAAIAEHYNRTHRHAFDQHDHLPHLREVGEFGSHGSDVPWWVRHPLFKGLVVTGLIMGALSPVFLKVGRADSEQRRKREHNDSFMKSNPEVVKLGVYQQNNYYCHAPFPGALDSLAYKRPHRSELLAVQIITRNGDRAPCGVLPFENNVTWNCDGPDLFDPSGMPIEIVRIRDEPQSLKTNIWDGNCWRCDSTGRGIKQQHMLGEALGDIYGELLEISPSNLYVRSVDSEAILRGVTGMIRGLMTNAINAGAVQIEMGMGREEDMLLPRLSACPRLAETWSLARSGRDWDSFEEKRRSMLEALSGIMSNHNPGNDSSSSSSGSKSSSYPEEGRRSWVTGERLPEEEEDRFALFLDTVRARTCNGMVLPCSPWNLDRCVSPAQAQTLFEAGDWSFHRKYTFKRKETASLFAGPLLALLLNNLGRFTGEEEATSDQTTTRKKGSVQVYSGEVDTVGGILAALNVTEWAWPPYASNIVLELWRRTEAEALPRVEGGQIGAEKFVRMLYNGRVVKPSFCQREECPLRTYRSHILQFLVPEDLEEACKPQLHPEGPPSQPPEVERRPPHLERQRKGA